MNNATPVFIICEIGDRSRTYISEGNFSCLHIHGSAKLFPTHDDAVKWISDFGANGVLYQVLKLYAGANAGSYAPIFPLAKQLSKGIEPNLLVVPSDLIERAERGIRRCHKKNKARKRRYQEKRRKSRLSPSNARCRSILWRGSWSCWNPLPEW